MKTLLRAAALAGLLALGCGLTLYAATRRAEKSDPLIIRAHFAGSNQLLADRGANRIREIWNLPGSLALRNEGLDRLAQLPVMLLNPRSGVTNLAALFRPLMDDLIASESYLEFRATPESFVAVNLTEARSKVWDSTLKQAIATWQLGTPTMVTGNGFTGWELKRRGTPGVVRFGRVGNWAVLASGPEKLTLAGAAIATITATGRPGKASGAWLEGDANLARFDRALPFLGDFENVPMAHFSFSNRADLVRTLVTLDFPKAHNWKPEAWRIPTNSIFDPLVSFVAVRGVAPMLDAIPSVREVGWSPTPSQFCGWGLRRLPFQFFYTTPARDITNQLHAVAPRLQATIFSKEHSNLVGKISTITNGNEVYWQGLPLAVPRLAPLRGDPNFLGFEMFPLAATKARPPKELFQQLGNDRLVYYDWEITEDRLPHWTQMYQLAEIATHRMLTPTNAASTRFITGIGPKLGESVTELTVTSPTQMVLTRKSFTGLTSFELVTLARWIESTKFPEFGVFPPQHPRNIPGRPGVQQPFKRK